MTTVHVNLAERSYDIDIGTTILSQLAGRLRDRVTVTHAIVIADANVHPLVQTVLGSLEGAGIRASHLEVPSGEPSKSLTEAQRLWNEMLAAGADRKSLVIAVGGGVVGDLAGFVAATFARGLAFCQVPTTLLAQVDSSVGGKVGINLPAAKNMVGSFWQPTYVLIDSDVLSSLPTRDYQSGLAEVVKYGVIMDPPFFEHLESQAAALIRKDASVVCDVVARCCRLKADVVEADERELTGRRSILNYGHTFAHAIESVTGYGTYLHGEAVSIGMVCASRLAERMGRIDAEVTQRQIDLLHRLELPTSLPQTPPQTLIDVMQTDKKVEHGQLRFVLPDQLGNVELVGDVNVDDVRQVLIDCMS